MRNAGGKNVENVHPFLHKLATNMTLDADETQIQSDSNSVILLDFLRLSIHNRNNVFEEKRNFYSAPSYKLCRRIILKNMTP